MDDRIRHFVIVNPLTWVGQPPIFDGNSPIAHVYASIPYGNPYRNKTIGCPCHMSMLVYWRVYLTSSNSFPP